MLFLFFIFFKWDFQKTFEIMFHQDNFAKTPVLDFDFSLSNFSFHNPLY